MNIKPNDLVLEVGSGDRPYPRADVLLDKLLEDSSEREAGKSLVVDRPLVIGSVEALPFADKTFDYIIASHVLEHAQDPAKFLDELSRVGRRGYIEMPSPLRERLFDWSFHRWYVCRENKTLILVKKTVKSKKFFSGMNQEKRENLHSLGGKQPPNLKFEWWKKIEYKILPEEPVGFLENLDAGLMTLLRLKSPAKIENPMVSACQQLKNKLFPLKLGLVKIAQSRQRKEDTNLFSLIVCPNCFGKLKNDKDHLSCLGCGRQYNLLCGKIPQLTV